MKNKQVICKHPESNFAGFTNVQKVSLTLDKTYRVINKINDSYE